MRFIIREIPLFLEEEEKELEGKVAKKAGISAKSFDAILNGKQTLYPEDLRAICYALNVKPEKFM